MTLLQLLFTVLVAGLIVWGSEQIGIKDPFRKLIYVIAVVVCVIAVVLCAAQLLGVNLISGRI